MPTPYSKKLLQLIIITAVLRLLGASFTELGNDEVYYWTYAKHLQWNYFDHPPMVAVWIRVFTANMSLQKFELFIRLGSIFSCAISTWLLFHLVKTLHSAKAAWFTACLYNASVYASIITGVFILPDSPQMIFWCSSLFLLIKILSFPKSWVYWIMLGICIGLCIMSKVHGVFLWFGFGLYILFKKRNFLALPQLYFSVLITALIISPILFWNMSNDFITYRFHSQRVISSLSSLNFQGLAREIYGEILYTNPFSMIIIISALISWRKGRIKDSGPLALLNFIAIPMISIFIIISLLGDTLPHWSGPAYVTLLPVSAVYLTEKFPSVIFPKLLRWSISLMFILLIIGPILINYYPGTMGKNNGKEMGTTDFSLDIFGWSQAAEKFRKIYIDEQKTGIMPPDAPVVCHNWFPAAHEDYYFCRQLSIKLIGVGSPFNLHHYIWLNKYQLAGLNMEKSYCIVPSNEYYDARSVYKDYYGQIDSLTTIDTYRAGKICRTFTVFRLQHWKGTVLIPKDLKTELQH
ncbi:MAG TPA: glycosyltransferase family 39 protein [Chitinophagaceae bacterium]